MTFPLKSFSFVNRAIKRIVEHIKANAKKQCFLVNLRNATFWKDTPRGQEILEFFKGMTNSQTIEFLGLFDIFVVGFHNVINAYVVMTADPSSRNFEKTLWVSISKGYNRFREKCSGRATPLGDLRSSIGSSPVQPAGNSTSHASEFQNSSVESDFQQDFSTFGPFQGFGGYFQPIAQGGSTDPFKSQDDFVPVQSTNDPVIRQEQTRLEIRRGRIVPIKIPSGCSSGPSTSSTVGISKSPKAPTPIATTIANLEKKIARLETENPAEGSLNHLELRFAKAKLEKLKKIINSL